MLPAHASRLFGLWLLLFLFLLAAFFSAGLVPQGVAEMAERLIAPLAQAAANNKSTASEPGAITLKPNIIAPDIGLKAAIVFPASANLDVLNNALTRGVVHYPGSALPGEAGNVFLFGHSTGLKVVNNKNFAVFNNLARLKAGDIVRLRYGSREYWYQVRSLAIKKAGEALVDLHPQAGQRLLTLSTCRIFGAKEDRYVVEAEFVKSYPLRSLLSAAGTSS